MDDLRRVTYGTLAVFVLGIIGWIGFLYLSACGFTTTCQKTAVASATTNRTPIPTLLPATMPASAAATSLMLPASCEVAVFDLLAAWVEGGYPASDSFVFVDQNGTECIGSFGADISRVLSEPNLWYPGSLACTECHASNLEASAGQLDLTSYAGITAGSRRSTPDAEGQDILGDGSWEASLLNETLVLGHPPGSPAAGPAIYAGAPAGAQSP